MPPFWRRFLGSSVNQAAGYAIGGAIEPALEPLTRSIANNAWSLNPNMPLDALFLAEGVVQGQVAYAVGQEKATHSGISQENFDIAIAALNKGPGIGTAFDLWRRNVIDEPGFKRAAQRAGLEQEWIDDLVKIKESILTPGELAAAIHRGLVPDPGLLKGEQPSGAFNVEAYPVYQIPTLAEAEGHGYDHDHLGVLVGLQGLPMGTHEAAEAYFRGIITHGDYIRAFNESNSRNEWAASVLEHSRQIPTARDFIENALRGYRTFDEAALGAALHGMSKEDARLIFQNSGRPLNLHQITQALAWGAKYNPQPGDDPDPYMNSVLIGSVTPAYYEMQGTLKYLLPGYFVVKAMMANGTLTVAEAATIFKRQAWPPDLADKAAAALAPKATGATENPYIAKADNQLWTALHKSYVKIGAPRAQVEPILSHIVTDAPSRQAVFADWDLERQAQSLSAPAA